MVGTRAGPPRRSRLLGAAVGGLGGAVGGIGAAALIAALAGEWRWATACLVVLACAAVGALAGAASGLEE